MTLTPIKQLQHHLSIVFKPDEVIWLKLNSHTFYYGRITPINGSLSVYKTTLKAKARKIDLSVAYDAQWLLNQSLQLQGGLFYIPGKPLEFPLKGYSTGSNDLGVELDWGTNSEQLAQYDWFKLITGLEPLILSSGGKSLHGHIVLFEKIPIAERTYLARLLSIALLGDPAVTSEQQPMRLAGGFRKEKGRYQELLHNGKKHTLIEVYEGLKQAFTDLGYIFPVFSLTEERWRLLRKVLASSTSLGDKKKQIKEILGKSDEEITPKYQTPTTPRFIYTGLSSWTKSPVGCAVPPLEYFLSRPNQQDFKGVASDRNNTGTRILRDLLGIENHLISNGVVYSGNAYRLIH